MTDLLRTVRFGGAQGRAAASSLLEAAQTGALKPHEAAEVKSLIAEPALHDVFKDGLGASLRQALTGSGGPVLDVKALLPDPKSLTNPKTLAPRFAADLTLMKPQLADERLPKDENAERLMEFFVAYAERFVDLTSHARLPDTPVTPMRPEEHAKALKQFEKALTDGGFKALVDRTSGQNGVELGRSLLDSKSVDELRQRTKEVSLEGPAKKDPANPNAATSIAVSAAHDKLLKQKNEEEERAHRRGRKGKLGANMVWNVLHLLRDGAETPEEKEALNQLIVSAALVLVFFAVVLTVLLMTL
ncbi:MAG: hypothetical protein JNJ54_15605 [Myxococcaceae bacterium]|nr:hypothetical protein [Myxococcaceae bacterium]